MKNKWLVSLIGLCTAGFAVVFYYQYFYSGNKNVDDAELGRTQAHEFTPNGLNSSQEVKLCSQKQILNSDVSQLIKREVESRFTEFLDATKDMRLASIASYKTGAAVNLRRLYGSQIIAEKSNSRRDLPNFRTNAGMQDYKDLFLEIVLAFEREDPATFASTLANTELEPSLIEVDVGGESIYLSPFGMLLNKKTDSQMASAYEHVLDISATGLSPKLNDIAFMIIFDYPIVAVDAAITEAINASNEPGGLERAFYINNQFRTQTLLSLAIHKQAFEIVGLLLDYNMQHLGFDEESLWQKIISFDDRNLGQEIVTKLIEVNVTPLSQPDAEAVTQFLGKDINNEVSRILSFNYVSLNEEERWQVDVLSELISDTVYAIVQQYHQNISEDCTLALVNAYKQSVDWNARDIRIETPKPMNFAEDNSETAGFRSTTARIDFDFNTHTKGKIDSTGLDEKRMINLDLDEDSMRKAIQAALAGDFLTIDALIEQAKNQDSRLIDEVLLQLTFSVLGKNEARFLQFLPDLDYISESQLVSAFVFEKPLDILKAMKREGFDINQRFSESGSNLLIEAASSRSFESFQFLLDNGLEIRPSDNYYDAIDLSIVRLAEDGDWRYLDAVMASNPELRDSNENALRQLYLIDEELYEQLVDKYQLQ